MVESKSELQFAVRVEVRNHNPLNAIMMKSKHAASKATAPIPMPSSHIRRTNSELQLAQNQLLADYHDGKMYERILLGILKRCDDTGVCHPKTSSSLENIMNTKMQDYRIGRACDTGHDSDRDDEDHLHRIQRSSPEKELSRLAESITSSTSSKLESEERDRSMSMSSLSCLASDANELTLGTNDIENGIFELEL